MQQRNLIVFILLAVLLVGTWYLFLAPPESGKKDDAEKQVAANKDKKPDGASKDADKKPPAEKEPPKKKADPEIKKTPPKEKEPEKKVDLEAPAETATLGGDGFHLRVDVTTRGAGIRKVVLNRFKAANWRGQPTDRDFELIQDDEFSPSFRMYHFPEVNAANPVFGLGEKTWTLEGTDKKPEFDEVRLSTTVPEMGHLKIVKTYRLKPKDYHVTLLLEISDTRDPKVAGTKDESFRYQLTGAQGLPIEGEWYTAIFRNTFMGLVDPRNNLYRGFEDSTRISGRKGGDRFPPSTRADNRLQFAGVANQYFAAMIVVDNEQPKKEDGGVSATDILAWARPTLETVERRGILKKKKNDHIFFEEDSRELPTKYLILPRVKQHLEDINLLEGQEATISFYKLPDGTRVATWVRLGKTPRPQFDDVTVRVNSEPVNLYPGHTVKHQFMLYHGPVKVALLKQFKDEKEVPAELVERYADTLHLRTLTDYHSDNWFGRTSSFIGLTWVIIQFTKLMHWLLNLLHYVFGYGFSIIVLTVIVRGAMFPISRKQAIFSIKMQELAPELKKVQDKYADDPQAKMQATQEFYRKHGINPLGSCWPVFLQMPIFLGLYFALQESIHFRLAGFWPLWIDNLAAPDMLFEWGDSLPWISQPDNLGGMMYLGPYLNLLPMIAVVLMMFQQMQTMPPPTDEQQAMQQKMLKFMTIFFGIMFYKVAAGLCVYFIASSLWGMAERKLLPKKKNPALEVPNGASGTALSTGITAAPPMGKGKNKWAKKEKVKEKEDESTFGKLKALWQEILRQAEKK